MHDGSASNWRETIDRHHAALADDLAAQLDAEINSSVALAVSEAVAVERERADAAIKSERERSDAAIRSARERSDAAIEIAVNDARERTSEETRRRLSESFNQTLRRIRQTSAEHETLQLLLEESALFAERAVVVLIENNQATIAVGRGVSFRDDEDAVPIDLTEAAALSACAESRDPLVALSTPGEVSSVLATALGKGGAAKVYLFPIVVRLNSVAVMLACSEVVPAPIELLCEATGMKLEALEVPAPEVAAPVAAARGSLVQIGGPANGKGEAKPATWTSLTPEEQAIHLRAQRTAKVRVAQIRISESDALRRGVHSRDIYGSLRTSIDMARGEFQETYMSQTPTMVDYLHLEILRSLAHDDVRLLGGNYPGPIA